MIGCRKIKGRTDNKPRLCTWCFEDTMTIPKLTLRIIQDECLMCQKIIHHNAHNRLTNLHAISTDILNNSSSNCPRNINQILSSSSPLIHTPLYCIHPTFSTPKRHSYPHRINDCRFPPHNSCFDNMAISLSSKDSI